MPRLKKPNFTITEEQLLTAETLGQYVKLKLDQLGIPQKVMAEHLDISPAIVIRILNGEAGMLQDRYDRLIDVFKNAHEALGLPEYSANENSLMRELNLKLHIPIARDANSKKVPNADITRGQLMETTSLGGYLDLKLNQLGVVYGVAAGAMGYKGASMIARVVIEDSGVSGYPEERLERLILFFQRTHETLSLPQYDVREMNHLKLLNEERRQSLGTASLPDTHMLADALLDGNAMDAPSFALSR